MEEHPTESSSSSTVPLASADMLAGTMKLNDRLEVPPKDQPSANEVKVASKSNEELDKEPRKSILAAPPPPMDVDGGNNTSTATAPYQEHASSQSKELSIVTNTHNNDSENERSMKLAASASNSVSVLFSDASFRNSNANKRRHSMAIIPPPHVVPRRSWDQFVRLGTRTKAMVEDVLTEAQEGAKRIKPNTTAAATTSTVAATVAAPMQQPSFGADLAREKILEVKQLQRQLEDSKAREAALAASNQALREQSSSTETRLRQTSNALRIAGRNAERARADADAAETTSATLAQTLQSLQTVVEETKLACAQLLQEQQEISTMASNTESKLIQKEGELVQLKNEAERLRQTNMLLEHARDDWKQERKMLEQSTKQYQEQHETIKRQKMEQTELEKARKERADKVEADFRRANTLLEEATAGQQSAKTTIGKLQGDITTLQKANADVHEKLSEQQATARANQEKMSENLTKSELDLQELRIKNEAAEEEMERLKLDKGTLDQNIQQLKTHLLQAQRDLKDKTASADAAAKKNTATPAATQVTPQQKFPSPMALFSLPLLPRGPSAGKENSTVTKEAIRKGEVCCICLKPISGMCKSCSCGKCTQKAHLMCVKNIAAPPSLSHPGTPAPALPTVLCKFGIRGQL